MYEGATIESEKAAERRFQVLRWGKRGCCGLVDSSLDERRRQEGDVVGSGGGNPRRAAETVQAEEEGQEDDFLFFGRA